MPKTTLEIEQQLEQSVVDYRKNCLFSYNNGSFYLHTEFVMELDMKVAEYLTLPVENKPSFYMDDHHQTKIQIADIDDFRNQVSKHFDQTLALFLSIIKSLKAELRISRGLTT